MVTNPRRIRILTQNNVTLQNTKSTNVLYWMSRDQRINDNWGLIHAQEIAIEKKLPLEIFFFLSDSFLGATWRSYHFMLAGLALVAQDAEKLNIPFHIIHGNAATDIPAFVQNKNAATLVTDFSPLKPHRAWKQAVAEKIEIPFLEVDAHNIVPAWIASLKQEFGAYTIRPKITKLLSEFLEDFPNITRHPFTTSEPIPHIDWATLPDLLTIDRTVLPVDWIIPGEASARIAMQDFFEHRLEHYVTRRNDPNEDGQSNLSPYLHFGQLSAERVAFEAQRYEIYKESQEAFLEELIIRRELSDNFCLYNPEYNTTNGFPQWAKNSLAEHRDDPREFIYTREEFEHAKTHDQLWNAAQIQMVTHGKMHGYMRMYWTKKILEWTHTPEEALTIAIYLNDTYELDGRDPNGYVGIAWSIGGLHDRAWFDRPIFGKIRYMNANGAKTKLGSPTLLEQGYNGINH